MNNSPTPIHTDEPTPPSVFDGTVEPRLVANLKDLIDSYGYSGVESTLQEMSDGALRSYMGTDAARWAAQYMRLHGDTLPDEGNLIRWFANAIEAGSERWR